MSMFRECNGCGERIGNFEYIHLERTGHISTGPGRGLYLGGSFDFCNYACVEDWARLAKLPKKGVEVTA